MGLTLCVVVFLVASMATADAVTGREAKLVIPAPIDVDRSWTDLPTREHRMEFRSDTTWYGQYEDLGGEYYAIGFSSRADGCWTFDRGTGPGGGGDIIPDGEGWRVQDLTLATETLWRAIDNSLDLGGGVPPPIITGSYSLWCGAEKPAADELCWECGAGYGDDWCQRLVSPALAYSGSGPVLLWCHYWTDTEECFDGTQIYLKRADESEQMLNPYPAGQCVDNLAYEGGDWTGVIADYTNPAEFSRDIIQQEIGDAQDIRIIFEFTSDDGWSDEDCSYPTTYGPVGIDDISIVGVGINESYDFETGDLQGWSPAVCTPIGHFVDIADITGYTVFDPCACPLEGNILEMHDEWGDAGWHPVGQRVQVSSPICWFGNDDPKTVFIEFDVYADLPYDDGVLYRTGWKYYPWECDVTGTIGWSPRVGESRYRCAPGGPMCGTLRLGGTEVEAGTPVATGCEGVIALIELLSSCEAFGIEDCSGVTNFTPLFDNISVGMTDALSAPRINFEAGTRFQDVGSYPSSLYDPMAPGPANVTLDLFGDTAPGLHPDVCGDSLVVIGPLPTADPNTKWQARLWWRVRKRAPYQADEEGGSPTRYKIWKDRVADGVLIDDKDHPQFASAWMDSVEAGIAVARHKFCSNFREDDDDFIGEGNPENEILWDDLFYPGTQIEYFVTSNYAPTPLELYYLPDTTGGNFLEFEILPGNRMVHVPDCGGVGTDCCVFHPATLYIDASDDEDAQSVIENALRTILNGEDPCVDPGGCAIPRDRNWDRYDYLDPVSNRNVPFVRGSVAGSNNGMTLNQILGYRAILLNTGGHGEGCMQDEDFLLFDRWLTEGACDANQHRQVFMMNGDKCGEVLESPGGEGIAGHGAAFGNGALGAALLCDAFNGYTPDPDCGAPCEAYCVRWLELPGGPFPAELDVDAFGSYCPNVYGFNTYSLNGGMGNRSYASDDPGWPKEMSYAQVCNEDLGVNANYRTILDGVSWHHMTERDADGGDRCPRDLPSMIAGAIAEIGAGLKWGFDAPDYGDIPRLGFAEELGICQGTWTAPPVLEAVCCTPAGECYIASREQCEGDGNVWVPDGGRYCTCDLHPCTVDAHVCCIPETGECLLVSGATCAAMGGDWHPAGDSCDPNSCPQPEACCFVDGTCQFVLPDDCVTAGGQPWGPGTDCIPDPCPGPPGACCLEGGDCIYVPENQCDGIYWLDYFTCDPNRCLDVGACCLDDGSCEVERPNQCTTQGGTFMGYSIPCDTDPCPISGACCLDYSQCQVMSLDDCLAAAGEFQGDGLACDPDPCCGRCGACCYADGTCAVMRQEDCEGVGGTFLGEELTCHPAPCPDAMLACCRGTACLVMTEAECAYHDGDWLAGTTTCDPNPCPAPPLAACCWGTTCYRLSAEDCAILGGQWHPEWLECLPGLCHEAGPPCPPGWIDCFERTTAVFLFEVPGVYEKRPIIATGPTRVLRHPAEFIVEGGGCLIETEIIRLDLTGIYDPAGEGPDRDSIAVTVTLDEDSPTYGTIVSSDDGAGNPDYPDTSWFNVHVLITFNGLESYPHTIDVGNLLASGDLWGDPPCVDPEGPYVSPSADHAHIPCPEELPEGGCVLDAEIGNGCFITSQVVCGLLAGAYLGDGTDCTGWVDVEAADAVPQTLALEILRNPSAAGVTIRFRLPRDGRVKLDIYDGAGRRVRRLLGEQIEAGTHTVVWDGTASGGHDLAPGIYFVRLGGEHGQLARKAMILR